MFHFFLRIKTFDVVEKFGNSCLELSPSLWYGLVAASDSLKQTVVKWQEVAISTME